MHKDRNGKTVTIGTKVMIVDNEAGVIPVGSIGYVNRISSNMPTRRPSSPLMYDVREHYDESGRSSSWMGWFDPKEVAVIDK